MRKTFAPEHCNSFTDAQLFGLCDKPHPAQEPAYTDTNSPKRWIATVHNPEGHQLTFTAVDHCLDLRREDGKMGKRCDGMLRYDTTVIFTELKQRRDKGSEWIKTAETQLRETISHFEASAEAGTYKKKRAYICNSEQPAFRVSQIERMERFFRETGYILRIEARIKID